MKKAIIATGIVASSMLYNNTAEAKISNSNSYTTASYQWTIETEFDVFTGTCESINKVNEEIAHVAKGEKILKKNITPMPFIDNALEAGEKIYTWNVVTNNGHSTGVSTSLEEAQRIVNSFVKVGVVKSSIVESFKTLK
ncbi:hypothetical protein ACGK9U_07050 [Mariniflexile sp. HNIBRBA6329]|uniref:hypothetical protein n=1 Tax=Mariniflexile sp. HNIBRBA6329 TaxID=3373088 RepID=UPI003745E6DD